MKLAKYISFCFSFAVAGSLACGPLQAQLAGGAQPGDVAEGAPLRQWLQYKSDLQRTSYVPITVGAAPNLVWRHSTELPPRIQDTAPLVIGPLGQRRVYFAIDRVIFCVDGETGQEIWRTQPLSNPIASPISVLPSETGDLLLVVTNRGQLNALRTSDGGTVWQTLSDKERTVSVLNSAPFLLKTDGGDRIILALGNGRLIAFTPEGRVDPNWEVVMGNFSAAASATPAVSPDGQRLFVPTQNKRIWVVNSLTGQIEYSISMRAASFQSPVIVDDHLLAVSDSTLTGMRLRTGKTDWVFDVKSSLSAPAARSNGDGTATVFVGARNGRFYAVNTMNGSQLWSTDLADSVSGTPTVTDDMVIAGTRNGMLFGLSPVDGQILWRYRLRTERPTPPRRDRDADGTTDPAPLPAPTAFGGPMGAAGAATVKNPPIWDDVPMTNYGVSTTPVVVEGQIYVLADNSALYSFGTRPFDADPPKVINPQLSIPNTEGKPSLQRLDLEKGWLGSGRGPVEFTAELFDIGSGVDPASIRVSLNRQELPASAIGSFSDITGKLLVKLTQSKDRLSTSLEDGNQTLVVTARDFRGNETAFTVNFMVDNTLPQPTAPVRRDPENELN